MKAILTIGVAWMLVASAALAQDFAVDKRAMIISGTVEFDRSGGDSYTDASGTEEALTEVSFLPAFDYFVIQNFFIGATIQYSSASVGDFSSSVIGAGPEAGYAFGSAESRVFPYGKAAFLYASQSVDPGSGSLSASGTDIMLAVGLIAPLQEHIGLMPQISYHMQSMSGDLTGDETIKDNQLSIGIGISGLIH